MQNQIKLQLENKYSPFKMSQGGGAAILPPFFEMKHPIGDNRLELLNKNIHLNDADKNNNKHGV